MLLHTPKAPLCKGRWILRSKTRRDCFAVILINLQVDSFTEQALSPAVRRLLPLDKGAFSLFALR